MLQFSSQENISLIREVLQEQCLPNAGTLTERYFVDKVNNFCKLNDTRNLMQANKKFISEMIDSIHEDYLDSTRSRRSTDTMDLSKDKLKSLEDNFSSLYRIERPSTPTFEDKKENDRPSSLELELQAAMAERNYDKNISGNQGQMKRKIVIDYESDVKGLEIEQTEIKETEAHTLFEKSEEEQKIIFRLKVMEKEWREIKEQIERNLREVNYKELFLATKSLDNSIIEINACF